MRTMMTCGVVGLLTAAAAAQPVVPAGFTARKIAPLLDGTIPQLEAIDEADFGEGVITASVSSGVLTLRLISSTGTVNAIGVAAGLPPLASVVRTRLDAASVIDGNIHVSINSATGVSSGSLYYVFRPDQTSVQAFSVGSSANAVVYNFDFADSNAPFSAVLLDTDLGGGTRLSTLDSSFGITDVNGNSFPTGRSDTDAQGFKRDLSGLYGGGFLIADTDTNNDALTAIYELNDVSSGGTYRLIGSTVPVGVRRYGDLGIAASGSFGGVIYITERLTDEIQQVAPDGTHTTWATGFVGIDSLSISPDGESMYVADLNGVWLIRPEGNEPGPAVLATDPSASGGTVLGGSAVDALRVIFTEPVTFDDTDVTITDGDGQPVGFDASSSGSQFMIIGLAEPLSGDTYTVTVADTVVSAATGQPLDGDSDGVAGGDATLTFTHACTGDIADDFGFIGPDGMVSFGDFLALLGLIGPCP